MSNDKYMMSDEALAQAVEDMEKRARKRVFLDSPWVAVAPGPGEDAGWTIWTRAADPHDNFRIAWAPQFPETEEIFNHIVDIHNAWVNANRA